MGYVPVGAIDDVHKAAERLFSMLSDGKIRIKLALFDRGFFSTSMLDLLNTLGIPYLMLCVNTQGVVGALNEFAEFQRMGVSVNMLNGSGKKVPYILIITNRRRTKDSLTEPKDKFIGFATNVPDIDIVEYDKRWGIETGYSMIEKIRVWTRSKKTSSRVFCFAFTLLLYNVWVTLNAMIICCAALAIHSHITQTTFRMILLNVVLSKSPDSSPMHVVGGGDYAGHPYLHEKLRSKL